MTSQLFIENYEVDMSQDISSLINFEIDSVRDFSSRSTSWSKTIVIPGTARNNKVFGHIFQVGLSNPHNDGLPNVNRNFNASKSADCILFQNNLQSFRGVLRLMQINLEKGNIEYEVAIFGEIALLNVSLAGKYLNDLDFSAHNHNWTVANIVASWDNTPGSGYFYPLIDYGQVSVDKHNYDIRALRPALYVKQYIDKMFANAGFTYQSDLFDTARFKSLIIPHNKKELISIADQLLNVSRSSTLSYTSNVAIAFNVQTTTAAWTVGGGNTTYTYVGSGTPVTGLLHVELVGLYFAEARSVFIDIKKNGTILQTQEIAASFSFDLIDFNVIFNLPGTLINATDIITVNVRGTGFWELQVFTNSNMTFVTDQPVVAAVSINGAVALHDSIPNNVRQLDFLVSIVKLFNLYITEDKFNKRLLYIKPYVDFYSTSSLDAADWSYKLNRDAPIKVRPMSELNAKTYSFKFKPDDDYWNRLYRERYRDGYGDQVFDSAYEFAQSNQALELTFSATPLVGYIGEDKVVSTIYKSSGVDDSGRGVEERIDTNIRIMQSKKIPVVSVWKIYDGADNFPGAVLTTATSYGYAGHFDDPDAPSNDLNFGITKELFFILASGDPSNTQFNIYWSSYMAEITDKDSKLISARFYLTPKDIILLDFSKLINIDGVLYRLNSIKDYNASIVSDCEVELLKVGYLIY